MVMHDDNPDRNYNFYAGMTDGIFGVGTGGGDRGRLLPSNNDDVDPNQLDSTYAKSLEANTSVGDERVRLREHAAPAPDIGDRGF